MRVYRIFLTMLDGAAIKNRFDIKTHTIRRCEEQTRGLLTRTRTHAQTNNIQICKLFSFPPPGSFDVLWITSRRRAGDDYDDDVVVAALRRPRSVRQPLGAVA